MENERNIAVQIKEMLWTLLEAASEADDYLKQKEDETFELLCEDIREVMLAIQNAGKKTDEVYQELAVRLENCMASLEKILLYEQKNEYETAEKKLEFEFYPLLRIAYARFYYFALVKGDVERERQFWEKEAVELCKNVYIEEALKSGSYPYDISIYVTAYNKLEYTKLCVEGILKNIPRTLRCELILINHGSNDGTKEYFESIEPEKQVDIKINSLDGFFVPSLIVQGKYMLNVSNDVIIGRNAIEVMYQCMEEDQKIAYVVPATPNISNLQSVLTKKISYKNGEEFELAARQHNKRDRRKEECRVRLLDPLCMLRTAYWSNSSRTKAFVKNMFSLKGVMFGDDAISLYFRRAGYKNVLLKDVYCHHFGSITLGKDGHDYLQGRRLFYQVYGVDAWEKGFCYTYPLFQSLLCNKKDAKRILGINAGMGSDPLKIREELKEHTGNEQVELVNYTMDKRFLLDLKGISDSAEYVFTWDELLEKAKGKFDYIILCGGLEGNPRYQQYIQRIHGLVENGGTFIFQSADRGQVEWFRQTYPDSSPMIESAEFPCCKEGQVIQYWIYHNKNL